MRDFIDKTSDKHGTYINRENLMAIQGMQENESLCSMNPEGVIQYEETNDKGEKLIVKVESGCLIEEFIGEKTITKKTIILGEGKFLEVLI